MRFTSKVRDTFKVEDITDSAVQVFIEKCMAVYEGNPAWLDADDEIKTINFAKTICEETARLVTLNIDIKIDGGDRAKWIEEQIDSVKSELRHWVEYACAMGTIILKPNGESVDVISPDNFIITNERNKKIYGAVFVSQERSDDGKKWYTRLEYHRFVDGEYIITNKCYEGNNKDDMAKTIPLEASPWSELEEEVSISGLKEPLFAVFKMPNANNVDIKSPLSLPVFASAIEELKDLDIAYSRNSSEVEDSRRIVLMDSDKLIPKTNSLKPTSGSIFNPATMEAKREDMKLPKYVRNVMGDGASSFYQEINPSLQTSIRVEGINSLLSQIGFKCGFSNGYFVFNQKTGMVTATQVESDDRRTIQTIKDIRDALKNCMEALIYTLSQFADLYDYEGAGSGEIDIKNDVVFDFGDITYNVEEDRARWMGYVKDGLVEAWRYFVKFEGMTEEDAKTMIEEAENSAMERAQKQMSMQSLFVGE